MIEAPLAATGPRPVRVALSWLPAIAYTLLIWWLSSQQVEVAFLEQVPWQDKGVHFVEYAALGFFIAFAVTVTWQPRALGSIATATLMTTTLGLLDELHQAFVPFRSGDVLDLAADFAGALASALVFALGLSLARLVSGRRAARA